MAALIRPCRVRLIRRLAIDEKLASLMGELRNAAVFETRGDLVVESVEVDAVGGFRLSLSGGTVFAVFPASEVQTDWLLARRGGESLGLISGRPEGVMPPG